MGIRKEAERVGERENKLHESSDPGGERKACVHLNEPPGYEATSPRGNFGFFPSLSTLTNKMRNPAEGEKREEREGRGKREEKDQNKPKKI